MTISTDRLGISAEAPYKVTPIEKVIISGNDSRYAFDVGLDFDGLIGFVAESKLGIGVKERGIDYMELWRNSGIVMEVTLRAVPSRKLPGAIQVATTSFVDSSKVKRGIAQILMLKDLHARLVGSEVAEREELINAACMLFRGGAHEKAKDLLRVIGVKDEDAVGEVYELARTMTHRTTAARSIDYAALYLSNCAGHIRSGEVVVGTQEILNGLESILRGLPNPAKAVAQKMGTNDVRVIELDSFRRR